MPLLMLNNLALGQRADGGLQEDEDPLQAVRRLVNYDFLPGEELVKLVVRGGYTRYNAVAMTTPATQIRVFVDQQLNEHVLAISNNVWTQVNAVGAHVELSSFAAVAPRPYAQWGNRVILGTAGSHTDDPGMVWGDHTSITATDTYRLGIKRPSEPPIAAALAKEGNVQTPGTSGAVMAQNEKIGIEFTPSQDIAVKDILIATRRMDSRTDLTGSWRLRIYTDNGGEPSTTMVNNEAITPWYSVNRFYYDPAAPWTPDYYYRFLLREIINLTAGTKYWFVLEGDESYHDHYQRAALVTDFYGFVGIEGSAPHAQGVVQFYNVGGSGAWSAGTKEPVFYIGGMAGTVAVDGPAYEYVYTYYNTAYQIESRPSDNIRIKPDADEAIAIGGTLATADGQVDKVRIYRRKLDNMDVVDADITDAYKFVAELSIGATSIDGIGTNQLGAALQTQDHYCLDDIAEDEDDEGIREAVILPTCCCMWKGRLWVGEDTNNTLKYSKLFEEDGATGMLGLSAVDYFPLDNSIPIPEPAYPLNIYPLSNDQLIVHMSNDTTYIIYGGDQSLNPPADFTIRPLLKSNASFGVSCGSLYEHEHIYLSREGIHTISGFGGATPVFISGQNRSIIDVINNTNLNRSVVLTVGNEIWTLLDFDNDGTLDTMLIVDLKRPSIPWRMYQYDVNLNDIDISTAGTDFQQVYGADAENAYILKLRTGTTDNGAAITAWLESHDLPALDKTMVYELNIDAKYPDLTNIPTFTWTLTDHEGNIETGTMTPESNDDIRGHRTQVRLKGSTSVRASVSQSSVKADEFHGLYISYTRE